MLKVQKPSNIRKAVALVTKADDKPLRIRAGHSSRTEAAGSRSSETGDGDSTGESKPNISVWDRTGEIPRLVTIETVCAMLALGKSAVYELVAKGSLMAPMKLTPGRRGASRWLLSDVVDFINDLAVQRAATNPNAAHSSAVVDGGTAK